MSPGRPNKRVSGVCTVCGRRRKLTDAEAVKLHPGLVRGSGSCSGSLLPPVPLSPKFLEQASWSGARRAVLARDEGRCRKCAMADDLQAHHIKERCEGGADEVDNLITLCSQCHVEWTLCESAAIKFDTWRKLPPMRYVVGLFTLEWPDDVSASAYKEQFLNAIALMMFQRYPTGPT